MLVGVGSGRVPIDRSEIVLHFRERKIDIRVFDTEKDVKADVLSCLRAKEHTMHLAILIRMHRGTHQGRDRVRIGIGSRSDQDTFRCFLSSRDGPRTGRWIDDIFDARIKVETNTEDERCSRAPQRKAAEFGIEPRLPAFILPTLRGPLGRESQASDAGNPGRALKNRSGFDSPAFFCRTGSGMVRRRSCILCLLKCAIHYSR